MFLRRHATLAERDTFLLMAANLFWGPQLFRVGFFIIRRFRSLRLFFFGSPNGVKLN
jgi:hypothetical protein